MTHLVLAQKHPNHFRRGCSVADAQSLVLDVRSQAASIDLDRGHLGVQVGEVEAGKTRGSGVHRQRLIRA